MPSLISPTSRLTWLSQARLDAVRAQSGELAGTAMDLADGFAELIRKRSTGTLSEWLAGGEESSDPDLRRFAEGIRRDEVAVHAAVTETWRNGPVEGHVNRLSSSRYRMRWKSKSSSAGSWLTSVSSCSS